MIIVDLTFVLGHMLRNSGEDNFVGVKDLNQMSRRIGNLETEISRFIYSSFDHTAIGNLLEQRPNQFKRVDYATSEERGPGFMRASNELFDYEVIKWIDVESLLSFADNPLEDPKYRKLRGEILEMIEPGLLATGYNPMELYK